MKIHQRAEVWVLVLGCVAAAVWVLMDGASDPAAGSAAPGPVTAAEPLRIHRCTLERDYGNARLDIELRYQNDSPRPLTLQPPDARLLTGSGDDVPPFVLPVEPPPSVAAGTAQDVRLRFWLEEEHLAGSLTLEIRDTSAPVKSGAPFNLERLENGKPRSWTGTDWSP